MRAGGILARKGRQNHKFYHSAEYNVWFHPLMNWKRYTLYSAASHEDTCGRKLGGGDEKQLMDLEWPYIDSQAYIGELVGKESRHHVRNTRLCMPQKMVATKLQHRYKYM